MYLHYVKKIFNCINEVFLSLGPKTFGFFFFLVMVSHRGCQGKRGAFQNLMWGGDFSQYMGGENWRGLKRIPAISLQACSFTENRLLHTYFSSISARFKLLFIVFQNFKNTYFSKHLTMAASVSTCNDSHTCIFKLL